MKNFIWIFILLFSTTLFSFDLVTIENKLNPNVEYDILNEDKQITIKEICLVNREQVNKNYFVTNRFKDSIVYSKYELNKFGNFVKKLYEDNNIIINEYVQLDDNSKNQLIQISMLDKKNNIEKQIMYKMIFDRNYPEPNTVPFNVFDIKIDNDNNILILFLSYGFVNVNKIDFNNIDKNIIYDFSIPNIPADNFTILSGDIISNNIIKVVRKTHNKTTEIDYFRIYQNDSDIDKNIEFRKKLNYSNFKTKVLENKLLWSESKMINSDNPFLSYDYFDQDTEPTIEQLKEKFPNDTFF